MKTWVLMIACAALTPGMAQAEDPDLAAGEAAYAETCGNCHGRSGRGMASFPSIAGKDAEFIASRLEQYRAGERIGPNSALMIPVAAELSDADIADVAAYVSTNFQ